MMVILKHPIGSLITLKLKPSSYFYLHNEKHVFDFCVIGFKDMDEYFLRNHIVEIKTLIPPTGIILDGHRCFQSNNMQFVELYKILAAGRREPLWFPESDFIELSITV